ncbi:MAG: DUF5659 domain-containing protein [candidate division Zixibacteria bacterium]|nr:DUF5659 domain-containing protein [candidate division Zixibacteria bacterium]
MKDKKIFSTSELALSAFLILNRFELSDIEKDREGRATFHLNDKPERPELVLKYFGKDTTVEPLSFLEEIRNLKALTKN